MGGYSSTNLDNKVDSGTDLKADMDLLNADDTLAEPKEETEVIEDELEKDEEEPIEKQESDEEEKPEEVEEKALPGRPTMAQIKAKYPDFFKDFPDVRNAIFRENEYTQIFPTVDEAKEASTKAGDFDHFAELIQDGSQKSFSEFLSGIKDGGSLKSMADNFLPSLYETDKDTYFRVTSPVAAQLIRNAYRSAERSNNSDLMNAALHLSLFAFNDVGYAKGEKVIENKPEEAAKDPNLEQERKQFYTERYNDAKGYVDTTASLRLRADIKRGLDPGGVFNEFTSNLLTKEIFEEVGRTLEKDERHMKVMNSLWKQANAAGFTGNWKDRILTTYLSGAKAVMPAIRARLRSSATGNLETSTKQRREQAEKGKDRKEISGQGTPQMRPGQPVTSKDIDWSKTSDDDFISGKITLRKR